MIKDHSIKKCSKCGKAVPIGDALKFFHKAASAPDGVTSRCKVCISEYQKERYSAGAEGRKEMSEKIFEAEKARFVEIYGRLSGVPRLVIAEMGISAPTFYKRIKSFGISHVAQKRGRPAGYRPSEPVVEVPVEPSEPAEAG